jgi:hypothetical protein
MDTVAAEKPKRARAGKRAPRKANASATEATLPERERQYVDIDPWAALLEGLMEIPEEKPTERTRAKGK